MNKYTHYKIYVSTVAAIVLACEQQSLYNIKLKTKRIYVLVCFAFTL